MYPFLVYSWIYSLTFSLSFLNKGKPSLFLVQISLSNISYNPTSSLLAFSHLSSFQVSWSTYGTTLILTFLLFLLILLPFLFYPKFPILLLLFFISIILFLFFFFFSFFFSSSFSSFFSFFFCFCYPDFPCFSLYCLPHSFKHLVILIFSVFQLISGLWWASYGISKITLHFCLLITSISVLSPCLYNKYWPLLYFLLVPLCWMFHLHF